MTRRPPSFMPRTVQARPDPVQPHGDVVVIEGDREGDLGGAVEPMPSTTAPVRRERVSDGFADRLAERQRARRRLRVRAVAVVGAVVLLLATLGYLGLGSSALALDVDDVTVQGTDEIADAADVLAVVERYQGVPLLRIDTPGLREELLDVVGVLDATVQRDFPHGLVIAIEPREPVATVEEDGSFVLLDADGVALSRSQDRPDGVPLVSVPVGTADTADALVAVLDVMAALPPAVLAQVTDASAATAYEVEFELDSGARVVWGSAEEGELKAAVLADLLVVPAKVYDVSAPLSPITRS